MPKKQAQVGFDDTIIQDPELEQLLEKREAMKQEAAGYRKVDKEAKAKIAAIDTPMPYRVGRFLIAKQKVPAKTVSFETDEGTRISIKNTQAE